MIHNVNPKARDRIEIDLNYGTTPTLYFDGGYEILAGASSNLTHYQTKIEKSGERAVAALDLITRVNWLGNAQIEINVALGNEVPANGAPLSPGSVSGVALARPGISYDFGTSAVDPDADALHYQFEWETDAGSIDTSVWLGPYLAGDPASQTLSWATEGDHDIRSRARDIWGEISDWSTPKTVTVAVGCCTGSSVGNVDGSVDNLVTMGDLSVLIDHLFISLSPILCVDEGNVDMSTDGLVTMGDLTILIDHLFISLTPLPACP